MSSPRRQPLEGGRRVPEVIVDFECSEGLLYVLVENIGAAPAHEVRVDFDRELTGGEGLRKISSLNLFRKLEFLPPEKKIRAFVDTFQSHVARKQPMRIRVSVTYHSSDGLRFRNSMTHDLSIYQDLPQASPHPR